jgi:hypothetical protein
VRQILARKAGLRASDQAYSSPEIFSSCLAAHLNEVVGPNNKGVDVEELDMSLYFNWPSHDGICDRNFVNVAPVGPAKSSSLEQVIDLIDKARVGWEPLG